MKPMIENETLSWIGERRTTVSDRFRSSLSALTIVLAVGWLASVPAAGQDPVTGHGVKAATATKTNTWTLPRTPDGQPDLQGVWVNRSATPFERPKSLEGKPLLTDDEVAELKRRADRLFKDGNADLPVGDNLFLAALGNSVGSGADGSAPKSVLVFLNASSSAPALSAGTTIAPAATMSRDSLSSPYTANR